jgi:hypothetical protein
VTDPAGLAALADDEIARLEHRKEKVLARRDEEWQIAAADAMPMVEDPETTRLRLYETMIRRWYSQSEKRLDASRQSRLAAAAGPVAQGPKAPRPPDPDAYAKMSDAAIRYQSERTTEAMGREHERWQAEQAQKSAHRTAAPPRATPTLTPTPTPTPPPRAAATSPSSPPPTPRPTPTAPPNASAAQAQSKPLNRFEQAEAERAARKARRAAGKESRRARRASR